MYGERSQFGRILSNVNLAVVQVALFDGNFSPVSLLQKYLIRNGNYRNIIAGLHPPSDTTSDSYFLNMTFSGFH